MGMTRHFVDALIAKGWKPYIKSQWADCYAEQLEAKVWRILSNLKEEK